MTKAELIALACQKAVAHGLHEALVCAVVEQESGWNPFAIRYEPGFFDRYITPLNLGLPTEERSRAFSWGLMQVMGQVARENGYKGFLAGLCDPEQGLEIGCLVLAHKIALGRGDVTSGLQLWNGGGNPDYAKEVLARLPNYQQAADLSLQGDT
jgi:soluble lytic murein transglycosylase-like protein